MELLSRGQQRKRASSPKLVLWNQTLINALAPRPFEDARRDADWWGRVAENAVGAHLLNHLPAPEWGVTYWRRGNAEVAGLTAIPRLRYGVSATPPVLSDRLLG